MPYPLKWVSPQIISGADWNDVRIYKTADYVVFREGLVYYSFAQKSGSTDYSGSDFSTVLQSTINNLASGTFKTGSIYVHSGTYGVNTGINLSGSISINGAGSFHTIFCPSGNVNVFNIQPIGGASIDNIVLREFGIIDTGSVQTSTCGIYINHSNGHISDLLVEDFYIQNTYRGIVTPTGSFVDNTYFMHTCKFNRLWFQGVRQASFIMGNSIDFRINDFYISPSSTITDLYLMYIVNPVELSVGGFVQNVTLLPAGATVKGGILLENTNELFMDKIIVDFGSGGTTTGDCLKLYNSDRNTIDGALLWYGNAGLRVSGSSAMNHFRNIFVSNNDIGIVDNTVNYNYFFKIWLNNGQSGSSWNSNNVYEYLDEGNAKYYFLTNNFYLPNNVYFNALSATSGSINIFALGTDNILRIKNPTGSLHLNPDNTNANYTTFIAYDNAGPVSIGDGASRRPANMILDAGSGGTYLRYQGVNKLLIGNDLSLLGSAQLSGQYTLKTGYVIYKSGSGYYAYSSIPGKEDLSGTDCLTVCNNALSRITGSGGGTLYFKKGTYSLTDAIYIYSGSVALVGEERDATILQLSVTNTDKTVIYVNATNNVTKSGIYVANLTLDANKNAGAIGAYNVSQSTFHNLRVKNNWSGLGMNLGFLGDGTAGSPYQYEYCKDNIVSNCIFEESFTSGSTCHDLCGGANTRTLYINNIARQVTEIGSGAGFTNRGCIGAIYINNVAYNMRFAFASDGGQYTVIGNYFSGSFFGFVDWGYQADSTHPYVIKNSIIQGNQIYSSGATQAMWFDFLGSEAPNNIVIEGNNIQSQGSLALGFASGSTDIRISNNYISTNISGDCGILASNMTYSGITTRMIINGNTIYAPGNYGIQLINSVGSSITNNNIRSKYGININQNGSTNQIMNNSIKVTDVYGINLTGSSVFQCIGNIVTGSTSLSFRYVNTSNGIVGGNIFSTGSGAASGSDGTNTNIQFWNNMVIP